MLHQSVTAYQLACMKLLVVGSTVYGKSALTTKLLQWSFRQP